MPNSQSLNSSASKVLLGPNEDLVPHHPIPTNIDVVLDQSIQEIDGAEADDDSAQDDQSVDLDQMVDQSIAKSTKINFPKVLLQVG